MKDSKFSPPPCLFCIFWKSFFHQESDLYLCAAFDIKAYIVKGYIYRSRVSKVLRMNPERNLKP